MDVFRSQVLLLLGNVLHCDGLPALIAFGYQYKTGEPLMNADQIAYRLRHSTDPFAGTLWFAAICGCMVILLRDYFGLFFDNRSNYLNMRMRLASNIRY